MPLITVYSPKGGVGKTTITANLCYSFASIGMKVLAIDFDVQNSLRLHFGVPLTDTHGYVAKSEESSIWSEHALSYKNNIFVLPYGQVTENQRQQFEYRLQHDELFLNRGLQALLNHPGLMIVADLPTGPSAAYKALTSISDLCLVPLLADTASMALLPSAENEIQTNNSVKQYFLLNQADYKKKVSRDVISFMENRLDDKLLGLIHRDESVVEANASQKAISEFNPASAAAFDIEVISKKITDILDVNVGDGALYRSQTS